MPAHSKSSKFNISKLIRTSFIVLVCSNLVMVWAFGGIFARFASVNSSTTQARTSKFGVSIVTEATGEYAYDDLVINKTTTGAVDDKLYFTLKGTPEVDIQVNVKVVFYNYYLPINNPDMVVNNVGNNHHNMPKNLTMPLYCNGESTGTYTGTSYSVLSDASAHTLTVTYDGTISKEILRFSANTELNEQIYIRFNAHDSDIPVVPSMTNKEVEVIVEIEQVD